MKSDAWTGLCMCMCWYAVIGLLLLTCSCNTVVTEQLDPLTGKPLTRTTITTIDPTAATAAGEAVKAFAVRGVEVHYVK